MIVRKGVLDIPLTLAVYTSRGTEISGYLLNRGQPRLEFRCRAKNEANSRRTLYVCLDNASITYLRSLASLS